LPDATLDITIEHTEAVAALPLHHRDSFDRLLVAQALIEANPIVSADASPDAYSISRVW
jgi:PIN domain nuclease of toxin-antitoxin system